MSFTFSMQIFRFFLASFLLLATLDSFFARASLSLARLVLSFLACLLASFRAFKQGVKVHEECRRSLRYVRKNVPL